MDHLWLIIVVLFHNVRLNKNDQTLLEMHVPLHPLKPAATDIMEDLNQV